MDVFNSEQQIRPQINLIREGVKIGLINGAITLLLMYGGYFAGITTFVNIQFIDTFLPYMIIILIVYGFQLRKRYGGYLTFKEALQYSFMSYVIAGIMVAIGTYILYVLIDKNLTQKSFDISIQKMREFSKNMGVPEDKIDKELGSKEPQTTTIGTIILGMGYRFILDFVKSLIIALIIRREKPAF
jgi:Protein of unknown function (DUF4199)